MKKPDSQNDSAYTSFELACAGFGIVFSVVSLYFSYVTDFGYKSVFFLFLNFCSLLSAASYLGSRKWGEKAKNHLKTTNVYVFEVLSMGIFWYSICGMIFYTNLLSYPRIAWNSEKLLPGLEWIKTNASKFPNMHGRFTYSEKINHWQSEWLEKPDFPSESRLMFSYKEKSYFWPSKAHQAKGFDTEWSRKAEAGESISFSSSDAFPSLDQGKLVPLPEGVLFFNKDPSSGVEKVEVHFIYYMDWTRRRWIKLETGSKLPVLSQQFVATDGSYFFVETLQTREGEIGLRISEFFPKVQKFNPSKQMVKINQAVRLVPSLGGLAAFPLPELEPKSKPVQSPILAALALGGLIPNRSLSARHDSGADMEKSFKLTLNKETNVWKVSSIPVSLSGNKILHITSDNIILVNKSSHMLICETSILQCLDVKKNQTGESFTIPQNAEVTIKDIRDQNFVINVSNSEFLLPKKRNQIIALDGIEELVSNLEVTSTEFIENQDHIVFNGLFKLPKDLSQLEQLKPHLSFLYYKHLAK